MHYLTLDLLKKFELSEAAYWSSYFKLNDKKLNQKLGIHSAQINSAELCAMSRFNILAFNRVLGLGIREEITRKQLLEIISFYKAAGSPRFFLPVAPFLLNNELENLLTELGFYHYNNWMKLYRPVGSFYSDKKTEFTITDQAGQYREQYGNIIVSAFEWPEEMASLFSIHIGSKNWKQYAALFNKTPVAIAAMHVYQDIGSLAFAATLKEHRGKGAQSYFIQQRFEDAKESGCKYMVVETAEEKPGKPVQSYRNMISLGFREAYLRKNYIYEF